MHIRRECKHRIVSIQSHSREIIWVQIVDRGRFNDDLHLVVLSEYFLEVLKNCDDDLRAEVSFDLDVLELDGCLENGV